MATGSPTSRLGQAPADGSRGQPPLRVAPTRRRRRPSLIIVGLVVTLGAAAVMSQLFLQVGGRSAVLAMAQPVSAGQRITSQDLTVVRISVDPGLRVVSVSDRDQVVGQVATVDLLAHSLLTRQAIVSSQVPGAGQAVVGVALRPGQMPNGLKVGDRVMVVLTPPTSVGGAAPAPAGGQQPERVLVEDAEVFELGQGEADVVAVASVVVAQAQAPAIARAQATGQISLVLVAAAP
jgi:hypothetical protein